MLLARSILNTARPLRPTTFSTHLSPRWSLLLAAALPLPLATPFQPRPFSLSPPHHLTSSPRTMGASDSSPSQDPSTFPKGKPDTEWRAQLSREQFRILREKGTEMAGTGQYNKHRGVGVYTCAGCATPLYKSTTKFDSGCGWPAFFDAIPGAVRRHSDRSWGMERIEITCTACGGHLGHVFKGEGFATPTDERHCVNSVSLNFEEDLNGGKN